MVVMAERQVYSVAEVAAMLGLSKPTVQKALKRGELPSFRVGTKVLVQRAAVERLLKEGGDAETDNHATTGSN
ncbi:MAG TPA: helix-turn-helix domain-containing protein [Thermomicrobiales bacterium]|jgi:excisionase family DNA binding protein